LTGDGAVSWGANPCGCGSSHRKRAAWRGIKLGPRRVLFGSVAGATSANRPKELRLIDTDVKELKGPDSEYLCKKNILSLAPLSAPTPELFPTEIRLRANGICNTLGRLATVFSPFVVGALMVQYKLPGVIALMIGLVVVQIIVVWFWGIEPAKRRLEELETSPDGVRSARASSAPST